MLGDGRFVVTYTSDQGGGDSDVQMVIWDPRENEITGSDDDDVLIARLDGGMVSGLAGDDRLLGQAGADILEGYDGADKLGGREGDDILRGGRDADYLSGGLGRDAASYSDATTGVLADLVNVALNTGEAAGDTYNSIENLRGSTRADNLRGNAGINQISGFGGDDVLYGRDGADVLIGDAGADRLNGGSGRDTASYEFATTGVRASLANAAINLGEATGDSYVSVENLHGSDFADQLNGDDNVNVLWGGAGADILKSYRGNDVVEGGLGADTFVFNSTLNRLNNVDDIVDFDSAQGDVVHLSAVYFSALGGPGGLAASAFKNLAQAVDANDRILYNGGTGELFYDADGSGASVAVLFARLNGAPALDHQDFFVF